MIIACHGDHLSAEDVEVAVMGGVAEEVGDQEGDEAAGGVGPSHHLPVGDRALAEVLPHQLVEGDELHRPQAEAEDDHRRQPPRRF